mgnify:CR=1 FL=1|tara:strand:- start:566 stop:1528 length:963 start_codon:yes stop_codon:yes gene_type:complete
MMSSFALDSSGEFVTSTDLTDAGITVLTDFSPEQVTPLQRSLVVAALHDLYEDEAIASGNSCPILQVPSSLLNFISSIVGSSTFSPITVLLNTDPSSAFNKREFTMEQLGDRNFFVRVVAGTQFTFTLNPENSVTMISYLNGRMRLITRGPVIGNSNQIVTAGEIFTFGRFLHILIGTMEVSVDAEAFYAAVSADEAKRHHGIMPRPIIGADRTHESFEHIRFRLRNAWNTQYKAQLKNAGLGLAQGPFRTVNNAGDLLSRRNIVDDTVGVPLATGQANYVYNSSDYTRFKKEMAHSKNYNDVTSGGGTSDNKSVVFKIV